MNGKNLRKVIFATAMTLVIALSAFAAVGGEPALANSAQRYWTGSSSSGVGVREDDCPLEVESELLTFDIKEFPKNYYGEDEKLDFESSVTAEYRFYNPSDADVTATLAFPFGYAPSYIWSESFENAVADFKITVDGEPVESTVRHTYSPGAFKNSDISRIRDDYDESGFYRRDLPVTAYYFRFSGIDEEKYPAATAAIDFKSDRADRTKYAISDVNSFRSLKDGYRVGSSVNNGDKIVVYVIGENVPLTADRWTVYSNGGIEKPVAGSARLEQTVDMKLSEIIYENYDESGGISRIDYFNAAVDMMTADDTEGLGFVDFPTKNRMNRLMHWYEYKLTVPKGGRAVNAVTAPAYPSIDTLYSPAVYEYVYLLSPASTWAKFGTLEIVVNTPYFMLDGTKSATDVKNWVKTENGYGCKLSALPDGELAFSLCSSASPEKQRYNGAHAAVSAVIILVCLGALVAAIIVGTAIFVLVYSLLRRKKRSRGGVKTGFGANKPSDYFGEGDGYPDEPQKSKPDCGEQTKNDNPDSEENKHED